MINLLLSTIDYYSSGLRPVLQYSTTVQNYNNTAKQQETAINSNIHIYIYIKHFENLIKLL